MAKFVYRLQNVLNIKLRMETQAKTVYSQAAGRLMEEQKKLNVLCERRKGYEDNLRQMATAKLNIPEMQRCNQAIAIVKELIEKQDANVKIAEANVNLARTRLNEAVKERKIYEKLKEKAFEEFKKEVAAEEKKEIDELVSFQYNDTKALEV